MLDLKDQPTATHFAKAQLIGGVFPDDGETILGSLAAGTEQDQTVFCHFIQGSHEFAITWGMLRRESARYAAFFQQQGTRQGEIILIILRHSPELFYAFLGAMQAGAAPSFMPFPTAKQDTQLYWASHRKLFERIGSGLVLTYPENLNEAKRQTTGLPWKLLETTAAAQAVAEDFTPVSISPDQVAFLQHSSGTTGLKKGVALSHRAVLRQIASYAAALKLNPQDRVISWLPLYHDMGLVACFLLPLITKTPVVMIDPFEWVVNPSLLFNSIAKYQATLCWQPNFAFHHLCRTVRPTPGLDLSSMRAWIDCSEPCRAETFELFARKFSSSGVKAEQLQVCYAMAETVFAVTQTTPGIAPRTLAVDIEQLRSGRIVPVSKDGPHQLALSTGATLPILKVEIRDETGAPLSDDLVGEISIAGECLFDGYFKLEGETAKKLRSGWYYTGDLGFIHDDELYVTGRKNDLIIVHGRNYYAHELEYLVNQLPGIHPGRNVATGWFRPEVGSEEIIIIAETDLSEEAQRVDLATRVKQALLDQTGLLAYDVHLVTAGWLVKTSSGKISRVDNLNKYLAARNAT